MTSSSSTSTTKLGRKHHVFLSFRGEDTRFGFTGHLHAALERKGIRTFVDDDLKRGEQISDSLVNAIDDSMISVIVFSKQYASSKWCLDELVKIVECRKIQGQIVIPIFYHVDPSDVRNQNGGFGDALAELVKRKALEIEEERCFRVALKEAASISGHNSPKIGSDSKIIDEIVTDICNKLCKMLPIHPMNLVGIDEPIREIESLLDMESKDVRIVGIWGMGGIGKTTIAGAVYNKIYTEFEASLFVSNIREKLENHAVVDLQRQVVSRLLDQKIRDMGPLSCGNHFVIDGLRHKKVLLVLDDVDSSMHLAKLLLEQQNSFGPGSRILVTSRDQQVLKPVVNETYRVEALNYIESLQLFKSKAFKKIDPTSDHEDLLERMVNYAKGNPLALVVLGSALCDRGKEDWHSASIGLGHVQNVEILSVLRISYDGLNKEQKKIFLDIACFFKGMDRHSVTRILEKKYPSVHYHISDLIYKSLMTTTFNDMLEMHDLLRDMAYGIVSEECENPRKRSRLVDPEDIYLVLKKRKGTKAVKGICLDMPESMEMQLKSDAFAGMRCLEFLIIKGYTSKVQLPPSGLEYLSDMLRYFRWDAYPSRSLPQNFCAENLVEFEFLGSKLKKLWSGQQNLVNLRSINLNCSRCLTKLPDLSKAKQLQYVYLICCDSLIEVPSCFQYFGNLEDLYLRNCINLQCLPSRIDSNKIKRLDLSYCSKIKKSPETSANIEYLYLSGTAIEEIQQSFGHDYGACGIDEVPSSIQFLTNLRQLRMHDCKKFSRLPSSIWKLKSLEVLALSGCSKLETFPEIMEPMESLKSLILSETAISELPSSIRHLKDLCYLYLDGTLIKELPELPPSLQHLSANNCESLGIISSNTLGDSMIRLFFANCLKLPQKALMADLQLKIQFGKIADSFQMVLPGSEIPQWFNDQSRGSNSITIQFPSNPPNLKAIAFCLVLVHPYDYRLFWQAKINDGEHDDVICSRSSYLFVFDDLKINELDHMFLCYDSIRPGDFSKYVGHEVTFEFKGGNSMKMPLKVKRCGVHLIFDEHADPPSKSFLMRT